MEMRATEEELMQIREAAQMGGILDSPEEFLLKVANCSYSAERISCIVFQADFDEKCSAIVRKLETMTQLCSLMLESRPLRDLLSIVLTLGNYMNGGNQQRGQADGFGLEILGKLKDVKSSDSRTTLLHYVVKTYVAECRKQGTMLDELQLPIPHPVDVHQAMGVDFTEVEAQVRDLQDKLKGKHMFTHVFRSKESNVITNILECQRNTDTVVANASDANRQPFQSLMESFLAEATARIEQHTANLNAAQALFVRTLHFFKFQPKSGLLVDCTPSQFLENWSQFCRDFHEIWKKELNFQYQE